MWNDIRFSVRALVASPGLTLVAVLTLALAIASNTTVFSWIDGLLLHPFGSGPSAVGRGRLAVMEMIDSSAPNGGNQTSFVDYRDYRSNLKSLSGIALHREDVFTLGEATENRTVWGELVTGNYFRVLGVSMTAGRGFSEGEESNVPGSAPVAVISERLWKSRYGGDPGVVGTRLRVNRVELTIIGVAPGDFRGTMPGLVFDLWIPATMGRDLGAIGDGAYRSRTTRNFYALVRLKEGISIEEARAEADAYSRGLGAAYPDSNRSVTATILPLWRFHSAAPDLLLRPLGILMAIAVLVLCIACANVANLLLARVLGRKKEFSIRVALGAGAGRIGRQVLVETLLLAMAGSMGGIGMALWMSGSLASLVPNVGVQIATAFPLSAPILGFVILACVIATVLAGSAPLLMFASSARLSGHGEVLRQGGRGGSRTSLSRRMRGLLVISEVALATVAIAGAGLFARSFHNAQTRDPGFDRSNVMLGRFYLPATGMTDREFDQFAIRLLERLRESPGVSDASYANQAPLGTSGGPYTDIDIEGYVPAREESRREGSVTLNTNLVAPDYFRTLRIPLREGREFRVSDSQDEAPVVIVNEAFVRRYWNGNSAIGRKIKMWGKWGTVIGVARDSKYFDVSERPRPYVFAAIHQWMGIRGSGTQQLFVFVRSESDPSRQNAGFRRLVASVDPRAGAFDLMPLTAWTEVTLLPQKVAARLLAALGLLSLLLAAVGLYSVMAYAVAQRTQEIGVRMAMGARPGDVLREVLREGMALTIPGLAAGLVLALAAARLIASMLVDVSATDPLTFAGVAAFLTVVALAACYLPARWATEVDPMVALRSE